MTFGCFVDIYQQDGTSQRMHYEGMDPDIFSAVRWIGIMEETAQKFRAAQTNPGAGEAPI